MSYRLKLFISFASLIFVTTVLAVGIFYVKSKYFLLQRVRSEMMSIGVTYADTLNGNYLSTINSDADTKTPQYSKLVENLRHIRDLNRRSDFYINYVCLFKKDGANKYIYIADAEEDPLLVSRFGDPFELDKNEMNWNPEAPYVDSKESVDQWGKWLSAFFPIYDSQNKIAAYLELDLYFSNILRRADLLLWYAFLILCFSLLIGFFIAHLLATRMTKDLNLICNSVEEITKGNFKTRVFLYSKDQIGELGNKINHMAKQLEEKERITTSFGKYVSKHILDKILKTESLPKVEGELKKITVLFSDIRHFTALSETMPPEDIVYFLNEYFEKMIEVIFHHRGTLDKFIGDGLMVEFGAPLDDANQATNAVMAALDMQKAVKSLCKTWAGTKYENIKIGIGIHTGSAVVGNIGSFQRMEYTAIGDTVNVSSRLEYATKEMQKEIIISEETYEEVKDILKLTFECVGPVQLRGREKPIVAYSVIVQP